MSYIGSTPTTQSFIAGTDSFNGTGSATNFTLSRFVNSVNDVQVVVNNVVQYPPNYSVSGNTLTISPAPSSGTNNVYVRYLSTTLQSITIPGGSTVVGGFNVTGNVGVGTASPLQKFTAVNTSITGGAPATSGSAADPNSVARLQNGTVALDFGAYTSGATWVQPRLASDYASNFNLILNPNGGSVGIGASSIPGKFRVSGVDSAAVGLINGASYAVRFGSAAGIGAYVEGVDTSGVSSYQPLIIGGSTLTLATGGSAQAAITAAGLFQFNSGYGSVATAYGCRAWVNFNGAGTVAIRASGNVSSITDVSTGNWTINFANAMPDANYVSVGTNDGLGGGLNYTSASGSNFGAGQRTTTACSVATVGSNGAGVDTTSNFWAIFR